jgi:hypothetical protein
MYPRIASLPGMQLRFALYLVGGPLSNALLSVFAFPFALGSGVLGGCCKFIVLGSAGMALLNLLPRDTKSNRSDGGKLFDLAFRPLQRKRMLLRFCWMAQLLRIRSLTSAHQHVEALALLDEQIRQFDMLLSGDNRAKGARIKMDALRPILEQAIATCDHVSPSETATELVTDADSLASPA